MEEELRIATEKREKETHRAATIQPSRSQIITPGMSRRAATPSLKRRMGI